MQPDERREIIDRWRACSRPGSTAEMEMLLADQLEHIISMLVPMWEAVSHPVMVITTK